MNKPSLPTILQPKTVDGVMSVFTKTIEHLGKVAEAETIKCNKAQAEIEAATLRADSAAVEAGRARKMQAKLRGMLEE